MDSGRWSVDHTATQTLESRAEPPAKSGDTKVLMNIRLLPIVAVALAVGAPVAAQESRTKVHSHESVTAEVHAAVREAQATIREVIRDVEVDVRSIERDVLRHSVQVRVSPRAGWAAKSWAESQESRRGPEQTERISKTFKVGPNGTLDLSNISGDIVINEGGGDTISVEAVKRARGSDTKEQFARTKVSMVERGGRVEVMTDYTREGCTEGRRGNCNSASVDYTVTAPADTSMNLRSVSGDIGITNIRGELRAESVSGNVTAQGATGATVLKSVSGDVEVSAVATQTELRMESVSGDVKVHGAKIRSLAAETVSGDLDLGDIVTDRVTGKSVSGSVSLLGHGVQGRAVHPVLALGRHPPLRARRRRLRAGRQDLQRERPLGFAAHGRRPRTRGGEDVTRPRPARDLRRRRSAPLAEQLLGEHRRGEGRDGGPKK